MEAAPGFEPGMRALQAPALPLGHAATKQKVYRTAANNVNRSCHQIQVSQVFAVVGTGILHAFGHSGNLTAALGINALRKEGPNRVPKGCKKGDACQLSEIQFPGMSVCRDVIGGATSWR